MTQTKRAAANRKRNRESPRQAILPLAEARAPASPQSKIIFQLKSELTRLQQRDREWKLMFNMLSHDLKEPLLTLEGFTKLLEQSGLESKDQKRYLKVIREAVSSLHHLVGSLQSIAKLYQEPSEMTDLSLLEILNNVVFSLSGQIQKNKGTITLPEEDVRLRGDPVRLYQIFLNLIANSLKYHKKNIAPEITVSYRRESKFHRVSIRDNGVGIDPQDLKRIFLPFTRLEDVPTDGMGIGLSIVKRIAESFGGRVVVRSQQGVGTSFSLLMPREEPKS